MQQEDLSQQHPLLIQRATIERNALRFTGGCSEHWLRLGKSLVLSKGTIASDNETMEARTMRRTRVLTAVLVIGALLLVNLVIEQSAWSAPQTKPQGRQLDRQNDAVKLWPSKAKRWALIVGVDKYRDAQINSLTGSVNDAQALARALVSYAGFPQDQVIVLTTDQPDERQPSRINILTYLSNLASLVPKDGLFLFSFAGHGIERGGQAFLIPSDARLSRDISLLEESAVSVSRMHDRIKAIGVGQVIVLLDACRNDPGGRAGAPNNMSAAYTKFNFDVRNREVEAFATLYATAVGQRAYEYTEKRQGYFTWAIVEALKGGAANEKGEITLATLLKYVQNNVPKRIAIDLGATEQQRPFATIEGYRADELVIAVSGLKSANANDASMTPAVDPAAIEINYWESIKNSTNPADFKVYLTKYPTGMFAELAKLRSEPARSASAPSLPSADDLLSEYFKAVGGRVAIGNLTTLVRKGSYLVTQGNRKVEGEAEAYEKKPGKSLLVIKVGGSAVSKEVFDGKNGWVWDRRSSQPATPSNLDAHQRSIAWDSGDVDELKRLYSKLTVKERKRIGDREVFVIEALQANGKADVIYIDCETKLPYRYDLITESVSVQSGVAFPTQIYLEDYVEINGVKIPMTIRQVSGGASAEIRFDPVKLKFNIPLEDKLFTKP